jgi:hypothetical protein
VQAASAPLQTSFVHTFPSSVHGVFAATKVSAGHAAVTPSHFSGASHSPAAGRQVEDAGRTASAGQALLEPSHFSTASHRPTAARQVVPEGCFASAGHAGELPSQASGASHTPAAARQTVPCETGEHFPALPFRLHAWQSVVTPPPHALLQHTPSTQLPFTHSVLCEHPCPSGFLSTQVPPAQYWLVGHGLEAEQPPEQTFPEHWFDAHCCVCTEGQEAPLPGQFAARVAVGGVPPHDGARHWTELALNPSAGQVAELPVQFSATSHTSAARRHWVVFGWKPSAGHVAELPVQDSATSHTPAEVRQTVFAVLNPSAGQVAELPVQFSATSHTPAAGRHTLVWGKKPSAGHVPELPVHVSTTSQGPFDPRQTAPALPGGWEHVTLLPSHWSTVHGLPSLVQAVPLWAFASEGHAVPLQISAMSHSPAAARHVGGGLVAVP